MLYDWAYRVSPLTITTNNQFLIKHFSVHNHSAFVTLFGVLTLLVSLPKYNETFQKYIKRYFTINWVTGYIHLQFVVHMFRLRHSESFLKFPGYLSSLNSWIWRSTWIRKRDLFIMHNTRKNPPLAAKVFTGVCLQPSFGPLQLAKSFQKQMSLILFQAKVRIFRLL